MVLFCTDIHSVQVNMAHLTLFTAIVISVLYLSNAQKCGNASKSRHIYVKEHNCDCLRKRAGQLKFDAGKLLVCDGSEWRALQYQLEPPTGSSCLDIRTKYPDQAKDNGVYEIKLNGIKCCRWVSDISRSIDPFIDPVENW